SHPSRNSCIPGSSRPISKTVFAFSFSFSDNVLTDEGMGGGGYKVNVTGFVISFISIVERMSDPAHNDKGTTVASAPCGPHRLHAGPPPYERKSLSERPRSHRRPHEGERGPSGKQGRRDRTDHPGKGGRPRVF